MKERKGGDERESGNESRLAVADARLVQTDSTVEW